MSNRILIGCEESGTLTNLFRAAGFEAYSCDLEPTRGNPDWHYQMDVKECIRNNGPWTLIISHPSCDALAVCGNRWYGKGMPRHQERIDAIEWTVDLWELAKRNSKRVALENPASVIFPILRKVGAVVQYVQPYQFGHMEQKKTGFAVHGLSKLVETDNVYEEMMKLPKREREKVFHMAPGPNRKRDRSVTYSGIARAIVDQWGKYIMEQQ